MPRPKPDEIDLEVRVTRRQEWREFRTQYLFSQRKLAEVLGISRRTVQEIEAGRISPHQETLRIFSRLKAKYEAEQAARSGARGFESTLAGDNDLRTSAFAPHAVCSGR